LTQIISSVLTGIERGDVLIDLFLKAMDQDKYNRITAQQKVVFGFKLELIFL